MKQLQGRAGRALLPDLPLLDGGEAGVEHRSKNRLADVGGFAEVLDLLRLQRWYRRQAHAVEFAHGELVHHAGIVKTFGRLIDGFPRCQDRCPLIPI